MACIKKMSINLTHPVFSSVFVKNYSMRRGTILIVDSDRESCRSLERIARNVFDDVVTVHPRTG